nr:MAG TPA: hypothetical protein [Caudoviricetes sp.]
MSAVPTASALRVSTRVDALWMPRNTSSASVTRWLASNMQRRC